MYFDLRDVELEIVEKTAIEDTLHLDGALKKLLYLGRDARKNKDLEAAVSTDDLDLLKTRLDSLQDSAEVFESELEKAVAQIRSLL